MFSELTPLYPLLVPFLLVLFRLLGIFVFVPFFSNSSIPGNVKALLGLSIAVCVWNVVPGVRTAALASTQSFPGLIAAIAGEMTVGLLIGVMLATIFGGIQMGAHLVSQQMGLSLAAIYDPAFEDQSTVIEQVAFWIALVAFLTMGGHREILNAVVYSYQRVPLGGGGLSPEVMLTTTLGTMDASFHAATRVAMPALVAFFVATLTAGLMARSMPQMNLMTVGIALHLLVGFIMVAVGLTGWAAVSRSSLSDMFHTLGRVLGG
jgi:flagellar biosynthesis protein FliR